MADIDTEELKRSAPIVEYVKNYYSNKIQFVSESSNTAKANCIWHQDKESPSLTFFKDTNTYKCFGCGEHGDLIVLVQKLENVGFQEACKIIGDNVGYEVLFTPPNPFHEWYKDNMDNHSRRYWCNYQSNSSAIQYMEVERGINKDTLNTFHIGVTDVEEYLYRKDIGNISNRISFPILEPKRTHAKCVGMGYRTLTNENPKYINDTNQDGGKNKDPRLTGVFVKGNCLYGYTQAYEEVQKRGFIIITEGYMDVLSLYQSGIKNCVCTMGTAITPAQIELIKKITNNVLLIMDSDKAGINSMMKILPALYEQELTIKICVLEKGFDPADLCLKLNFDTKKVYENIKANSMDAINFIIDDAVKEYEALVIQKRKEILTKIKPLSESMKAIDGSIFYDMLYKRLDLRR